MIKGAARTIKDALEYNLAHGTSDTTEAVPDTGADSAEVSPTSGLMTFIVKYATASQRL